jgi:hypothetical protein
MEKRLPLYRVSDWDQNFENAKSRSYNRCQYTCIPNKQGGAGWSYVMGQADGSAVYGNFHNLLLLLSRQSKPREGWLTANGKKDGRRFAAQELAHIFRRQVEEIHRMLMVCSKPEAGFIELVEGESEYDQEKRAATDTPRIPDGYYEDTSSPQPALPTPDTERILEGYSTDTPSDLPASARVTDSNDSIVRKKAYLSARAGEPAPEGQSEDSSRSSGILAVSAQYPDETVAAIEEAKGLLADLSKQRFNYELRPNQWPFQLEHALSEQLPMPRSCFRLIDWAYRLEKSHPIFERNPKSSFPGLVLRGSFQALVQNASAEAQKIASARKAIGLNGLGEVGGQKSEVRKEEPEGWRQTLRGGDAGRRSAGVVLATDKNHARSAAGSARKTWRRG